MTEKSWDEVTIEELFALGMVNDVGVDGDKKVIIIKEMWKE